MSFDAELFDSKVQVAGLSAFKAALAPLSAFSYNASLLPNEKGGSINVMVVPAKTAIEFAGDQETSTESATAVSVSLNGHAWSDSCISDATFTKSTAADINKYGINTAKAVAEKIVVSALSNATLANYGAAVFTGSHTVFDYADLADIGTACSKANMPKDGRTLIINPDYVGALRKDANFSDASAFGSAEVVKSGAISYAGGFTIYESNIIPSLTENLVGIACVKEGLAVAISPVIVQGAEAYLETNIVTDEESGIALTYKRWVSTKTGKQYVAFQALHGSKPCIAAGLKRIVSA
jgi:hypothetical protein